MESTTAKKKFCSAKCRVYFNRAKESDSVNVFSHPFATTGNLGKAPAASKSSAVVKKDTPPIDIESLPTLTEKELFDSAKEANPSEIPKREDFEDNWAYLEAKNEWKRLNTK